MKAQLQAKLAEIKAQRNLDVASWVEKKAVLFNEYARKSGLKAAVVNVSGGIDSALTILLANKAKSLPDSPIQRVVGLVQPIYSTESIIKRAVDFLEGSKLEYYKIDQSPVLDLLVSIVEKSLPGIQTEFSKGNFKSYLRTPVAFYVAQLLSGSGTPAVVVGTGNYDEDGYLYYFCKAGDGTNDVQLIHDLHKSEVSAAAKYIGVPQEIIDAPPSADLWPGQTDENEIGFSYDFVELYTELLARPEEKEKFVQSLDEENLKQWNEVSTTIDAIHQRNKHKEYWPVNLDIISPTGQNYA
jgi:NAD+ synthase (glutamine-hydrolysing)